MTIERLPGLATEGAATGLSPLQEPHVPRPGPGEPGDHLIGIGEIRALFGLGRTAAYELVHRPGFPAVVAVSPRSHRWWASEVRAFTASLQAAGRKPGRHSSAPQPAPDREQSLRRISGKVRYARDRRSTANGETPPGDGARRTDI